jgi:Uma2 family endonuclease
MVEEGLLAPDAPVELIDGEIIDMPPIGAPHAAVVDTLARLFQLSVGDRATVRVQNPLRLSRFSEVQPDVQLLAPRADRYWNGPPAPADVLLAVEVCASTLKFDRDVKVPLYAKHGVPEAWLIDIEGRRISLFRSLNADRYEDVRTVSCQASLSPVALADVSVDLSGLLRN